MLRTVSPITVTPSFAETNDESMNHKWLLIADVDHQIYHYRNENIKVIRPNIGSVLIRTNKSTKESEKFVVVSVSKKTRGINRGIIDGIRLEPVFSVKRDMVLVGSTIIPFTLRLTNHGNWWSNNLAKRYEFKWGENPKSNNTIA